MNSNHHKRIVVAKQVFPRNLLGRLSCGDFLERRSKLCTNKRGHTFLCLVDIHQNAVVVCLLLTQYRMLYDHFSCLRIDRILMLTNAVQLLSQR